MEPGLQYDPESRVLLNPFPEGRLSLLAKRGSEGNQEKSDSL